MIYEQDGGLLPDLQRIGCYAECIAVYDPAVTAREMDIAWRAGKMLRFVAADGTLVSAQGLVDIFGYPLKYRVGHLPATTPLIPARMWIIGEWYNPATKFTHFVVMDGLGTDRLNVKYDPIKDGSRTVREGSFVSYRLFDMV